MSRDKRERHRLKRVQKRKQRQRQEAMSVQSAGRLRRAWRAADQADAHFRRGETDAALTAAARAAALSPRDLDVAELYVAAAERSGDIYHRRQALERWCVLTEPDVPTLLTLANLCLSTGRYESAAEVAARARAAIPRRVRDRRRWLAFLDYVDQRCAQGSPEPLPLFGENLPAPARHVGPPAKTAKVATDGQEDSPVHKPAVDPQTTKLEIPVMVTTAIDGVEAVAAGRWSTTDDVGLSILAAQLRDAESFDRLLSVEQARGLLRLSHQEETARKVLSVFLGRALLADEVGLGKTVEAGLVLSEYLLRGRVRHTLVLTPPSLVAQWREELASKFAIDARTTDDSGIRKEAVAFWSSPGVVIASLPTARSPRHRDIVQAQAWDMIIVDEAHALKNARTQSYALVSRLTSRFLLLLTATPVENNVTELYNLVSLIRPGHLGGRSAFQRRFGNDRGRVTEAMRRQARDLLGEIMVRNTRALSGVRLPPRFARTVLIEPQAAERELYGHIASALRALGAGGRTRLFLSVLLQEAGSSPHAVRNTLRKLRDDPEGREPAARALAPAIGFAERAPETAKGRALLRILEGTEGATVVFTRFRATLDYLTALLESRGIACERIDGTLPTPARHAAIHRCRERNGVLAATEIGSEGLNLQFCHRLVNFDLPWNPMRIEQRIGRVHRIGQDHPVEVINFCLAGSIEERILHILDERINLFELVVGEMEMILGYIEPERGFDDLVLDAFAEAESDRRERAFEDIGAALAAARGRYRQVKSFDEALFRNELGV